MNVRFSPSFLRQLKKLDSDLQDVVFEKVEMFEQNSSDKSLKVHKLKGRLSGDFSFSVDYKNRIIFEYLSADEVVLTAVGSHDVYKK